MKSLLVLMLLGGCAPMYRPHLVRSPMLEAVGDRQVAGSVSPGGGQLGVAWAASPQLGLRADVQLDFMSGPYALASVGVGHFRAGPRGLRLGLWLDGGGGLGSATSSTTITTSAATTTSTVYLSGSLLQVGGTVEVGYESQHLATGLELRGVSQWVVHDGRSDAEGVGRLFSLEPVVLLRLGSGRIKGQAFLGLSLPVYGDGDTGVQLPLVLGLGLVGDRGLLGGGGAGSGATQGPGSAARPQGHGFF